MARPVTVRAAAIGALIVSLTAGLASNLLFLAAFQFRIDWFLDPQKLIWGRALAEASAGRPAA